MSSNRLSESLGWGSYEEGDDSSLHSARSRLTNVSRIRAASVGASRVSLESRTRAQKKRSVLDENPELDEDPELGENPELGEDPERPHTPEPDDWKPPDVEKEDDEEEENAPVQNGHLALMAFGKTVRNTLNPKP
mmetsp:Transcript_12445/g.39396  ORF Transcript_12445/g.39396 Transcript_12445/m.39396 type:complete len:135 (-) Transcript_12445:31-435(-)